MNKMIACAAVAVVALASFAENAQKLPFDPTKKPVTEEEKAIRRAYGQKRFLEHTGGKIEKPGSQKGEIAYVDCQKSAKREWIAASQSYFANATALKVTLQEGTFDVRNPKLTGDLTLFVIDDATLPMSLVAPEARWAAVNVAKLKSEKEAFYCARLKKELARTFAMLCGGSKSSYSGNLSDAITKVEDLDTHMNDTLPVDVLARFVPYLSAYGVSPARVTTYLNACKQGWAPAPTNEYQKVIWDKVHTIPTNPIKIKYDGKKTGK